MSDDLDTPAEDPLVGQVIQERFRVEKKLGQGGMGAIYLAEHLLLKKKVAIKCLHAGLASNPDVVRRFKNEAVAASSIGHPNIVEVMDMGRFDDGTFYMVLEYLDGRDFQEDLDAEGPQPVNKVAHIGVQVCAALGAAAKKGIVHRDLKPENIFLVRRHGDDAFVKVLDFGISKILDGSGGATKTGELMGTPYYMAPEQVMGDSDITHLADVYALGVILFQALSGRVPFDGNALAQVIMKIATQPTPSVRQHVPDVPELLEKLISRMMAKEPLARPQTFQEVALGLGPFLAETSPFSQPGALEKVALASLGATLPAFDATELGTTRAPFGEPLASARTAFTRSEPRPMQVSRPHKWMLGAAAALLLGVVTWALSSSEEDIPESEAEKETAQETKVSAKKVRVEISTVPSDAQVFLDGKRVDNPFDGVFEKGNEGRELVVKRSGYEEERRKIVLTTSQNIVIVLSKSSASKQRSGATSAAAPSPKPAASPRPTSSPAPQPSSGSDSDASQRSHTPPKPIRDLERGLKKLF